MDTGCFPTAGMALRPICKNARTHNNYDRGPCRRSAAQRASHTRNLQTAAQRASHTRNLQTARIPSKRSLLPTCWASARQMNGVHPHMHVHLHTTAGPWCSSGPPWGAPRCVAPGVTERRSTQRRRDGCMVGGPGAIVQGITTAPTVRPTQHAQGRHAMLQRYPRVRRGDGRGGGASLTSCESCDTAVRGCVALTR